MNSELKGIYETYILKFIGNICENQTDRESLMTLWKTISSSNVDEEIKVNNVHTCQATIKSGARKNQVCGIQIAGDVEFCKRHEKKPPTDKPLCKFTLKSGKTCKKQAKELGDYCIVHDGIETEIKTEETPADDILYFREEDLYNTILYTKYKNGYIHNQTKYYLKISKKSGNYRVYGIVEDGELFEIDQTNRNLQGIEYN